MNRLSDPHLPKREPRFMLSGALAAGAALLLDAFYVYIQYGQNPADFGQARVRFWTAYTAAIALAAAVASVYSQRQVRVALLSVSAWGALVSVVVGIFSVGLLYLIPLALALTALGRTLDQRLEFLDILLTSAASIAMVWLMIEGLQVFPLA